MKKEIIFKGYCKEKGKWIFGNLVQCENGTCIAEIKGFENRPRERAFIIGHFTELRDEDDNIYKGDILMLIDYEHASFEDRHLIGVEHIYVGYMVFDNNICKWRIYPGEPDNLLVGILILGYFCGYEMVGTTKLLEA